MEYPITSEFTFSSRTAQSLLRRLFASRTIRSLPPVPAGHALVLQTGQSYVLETGLPSYRDYPDLSRGWLVDVRPTFLTTTFELAGASSAETFQMVAHFKCIVRDPATAVRSPAGDIKDALTDYLQRNDRLRAIAARYEPQDYSDLVLNLVAANRAYSELVPADLAGIEVTLSATEVEVPAEVRQADAEMKARLRQNNLEKAKRMHDEEEVEALSQFVQGDPFESARKLALLGLQDGSLRVRDVLETQLRLIEDTALDNRAQQELRIRFAAALVDRGIFDRSTDALDLVTQVWRSAVEDSASGENHRPETRSRLNALASDSEGFVETLNKDLDPEGPSSKETEE